MKISEQLRCLFSATVEKQDDSFVVEVPEQEIRLGDIQQGETYRVAVLPSPTTEESDDTDADSQPEQAAQSPQSPQTPPVEEGEQRTVEIEDIGEQGDGITRVERGFVVIVPDTQQGERVTVEITDVRQNVAFAEVLAE
jgi:predicted RNA-binding protein with TRAM domain